MFTVWVERCLAGSIESIVIYFHPPTFNLIKPEVFYVL